MISRIGSGSSHSASAVEFTRSMNKTVTCLRASCVAPWPTVSPAPHLAQKRSPCLLAAPQAVHVIYFQFRSRSVRPEYWPCSEYLCTVPFDVGVRDRIQACLNGVKDRHFFLGELR